MNAFASAVVLALAGVLALGWLGFQLPPPAFAPDTEVATSLTALDLPRDLPAPVRRYAEAVFTRGPVHIHSAVVSGVGRIRNDTWWAPLRFRASHTGAPELSRYTEVTWFGVPLLRSLDYYVDGAGALVGAGVAQLDESGPRATQAEYLSMWAQLVWMPSVLLTHSKTRWEAVDATTARLIVPFAGGEEALTVAFAPTTGRIRHVAAARYRSGESETTPWRAEFDRWKRVQGVWVPTAHTFIWEDQGPYARFVARHLRFNADVPDELPTDLRAVE